jgi:hypothetical protein
MINVGVLPNFITKSAILSIKNDGNATGFSRAGTAVK